MLTGYGSKPGKFRAHLPEKLTQYSDGVRLLIVKNQLAAEIHRPVRGDFPAASIKAAHLRMINAAARGLHKLPM